MVREGTQEIEISRTEAKDLKCHFNVTNWSLCAILLHRRVSEPTWPNAKELLTGEYLHQQNNYALFYGWLFTTENLWKTARTAALYIDSQHGNVFLGSRMWRSISLVEDAVNVNAHPGVDASLSISGHTSWEYRKLERTIIHYSDWGNLRTCGPRAEVSRETTRIDSICENRAELRQSNGDTISDSLL